MRSSSRPPRFDPIYFDHNASTPVLPRVKSAMTRALDHGFGNPSSDHAFGKKARAFVETGRAQVAALLGCDTDEILFTSGGTEANNLALRGFSPELDGAIHLITTDAEHPAVAEPAALMMRAGSSVVSIAVTGNGVVDLVALDRAIKDAPTDRLVLVSVIFAQNETGVVQPIGEIAKMTQARGAIFHTDAAQAVGKIPVDVRALGVDLLTIAGHKLYAPKGVGALYVRRGVRLSPVLVGAGHERGVRPGTENVAGIAALGEACALAREDIDQEAQRLLALRTKLETILAHAGFIIHGRTATRLPNTINGRFPHRRGSEIMRRTPEIALSTGSACHAGEEHPSRVLTAMGFDAESALGALRISLGRMTTEEEIDRAAGLLIAASRA